MVVSSSTEGIRELIWWTDHDACVYICTQNSPTRSNRCQIITLCQILSKFMCIVNPGWHQELRRCPEPPVSVRVGVHGDRKLLSSYRDRCEIESIRDDPALDTRTADLQM